MSVPLTARITPEDALAIAEYEKQYSQYEQDMEVYNNRIKEYNKGPRTESFQYTQPTAPVPTVSQQQVSERTQEDLQRRSMGVSAFADPSQFNLSGFGIGSLPSVGNLAGFSSRSFGGIGGLMSQGPVSLAPEEQAGGIITLPDGTIFDPSQIKIDPIKLGNFKMPFEGMTQAEIQESLKILGQQNPGIA
tara:strand:+ start:96 stop:665 length:570 start_codon:yes stop_codon:yes gene_type:complete